MKRDIFINLLFTLSTSIMAFVQNKYFIQYLGIDSFGILKLFNQILAYLNIVEMGLGSASTYALYKPLANKDYKSISSILHTMVSTYNKIAFIIFTIGILVTPFLSFFINSKSVDSNIYIYWILFLINTISTYLYIKYVILFTANQEFIYVKCVQSISKLAFQIIQIYCIIKFRSFILFIIFLLLDNLTQYILFKIHFKQNYNFIYSTKEKYSRITTDIKNIFWHKMAFLIVFNTDLILISKFVSLKMVGIYANYQLITRMLYMAIRIPTQVIIPKIGNRIATRKNNEEIFLLFKKLDLIYYLVGVFFAIDFYFLVNYFIKLWIGDNFVLQKSTIMFISFDIFVVTFRQNLDSFKESYGFFDDIELPILESVINFILSIILGLKYGINGILAGTAISNIIVILILRPILLFTRYFDKTLIDYILLYGKYMIFGCIVILLINKIGISLDNITTWLDWVIQAIKISLCVTTLIFIVFAFDKDIRVILYKIFSNIFKITH